MKLVLGILETWATATMFLFPSLSLFGSSTFGLDSSWSLCRRGEGEGHSFSPQSSDPRREDKISLLAPRDKDPGKDPNCNSSSHMSNCRSITSAERWGPGAYGLMVALQVSTGWRRGEAAQLGKPLLQGRLQGGTSKEVV